MELVFLAMLHHTIEPLVLIHENTFYLIMMISRLCYHFERKMLQN